MVRWWWFAVRCVTIVTVTDNPEPTGSMPDPTGSGPELTGSEGLPAGSADDAFADGPLDPFGPGIPEQRFPSKMGPSPNSRKGTSGRTVLIVFGIGALVSVLSLVGVAFVHRAQQAVSVASVNESYTDTTATLEYEVTKRAQDTVVCTVQALDEQFTVVGETDDVHIEPGQAKNDVTTVVQTSKKANVVQVDSCVVEH